MTPASPQGDKNRGANETEQKHAQVPQEAVRTMKILYHYNWACEVCVLCEGIHSPSQFIYILHFPQICGAQSTSRKAGNLNAT